MSNYHSENVNVKITKNEFFQRLYCGDTPILTYHILYPQFSGILHGALRQMNRYYKRVASTYQHYYRTVLFKTAIENYKNAPEDGFTFQPFEANLYYEITLNHNCIVSLYYDRYEFTGGAHGNTVRFSDTWYIPLCKRLTLSNLLRDKLQYPCNLTQIIVDEIRKNPESYFPNPEKTVNDTMQPQNFYLSPQYLNIYFNQYDIAPYSSGIPVFSIPYERVGIVLPK